MNKQEFEKVSILDYDSYCKYLQNKYGLPEKPYFRKTWTKNKITRTKEGLFIHHIKEDVAIMLSTENFAKNNPYEYQLPENLLYCDYLEHLLLHILICEDLIIKPDKKRNKMELPGYGGVVNLIGPELNDIYSGYRENGWKSACIEKIKNDENVYLAIMERFIKNFFINWNGNPEELVKSYNANHGNWSIDNNIEITNKLLNIWKKYASKEDVIALEEYLKLREYM